MKFSLILLISGFFCQATYQMEEINGHELMNIIRSPVKYVVVLFATKDCSECDRYQREMLMLTWTLTVWVMKLVDSPMARLYIPHKEPAVVFFRHGIPLLYEGPVDGRSISDKFSSNKESTVRELNDDNFEYLTEAASGVTTGDWFVQFYTTDCEECQRMRSTWEALGAELKSHVNVVRMNRDTTGAMTARRYGITEVPTYILFKKGKMFKYVNRDLQIESLVKFTQEWTANLTPYIAPVQNSTFDDLVAATVTFVKDNSDLLQVGFASFVLGLVISTLIQFVKKSVENVTAKPDKSQKKGTRSQKVWKGE